MDFTVLPDNLYCLWALHRQNKSSALSKTQTNTKTKADIKGSNTDDGPTMGLSANRVL